MLHRDGTKYADGLIKNYKSSTPSMPNFVIARINEVLFTDNPNNSSNQSESKEIEYNCIIVGGPLDGVKIFNVKDTVQFGGKFNMSGQVRTPMFQGNLQAPIQKASKTDGDIVMIAFLDNNPYKARIIAGVPHPLSNCLDIKSTDSTNYYWEFNGMFFGIDKDGALSISFNGGPKDKDGKSANENASGSSITITKDGIISLSDNEGQKIEIDRNNKSINLVSADKISTEASGNWDISVGGNVSIEAGGTAELNGAIVQIGGSGNLAARVGDLVIGTDSQGGPVTATIQTGSSTTLIGG